MSKNIQHHHDTHEIKLASLINYHMIKKNPSLLQESIMIVLKDIKTVILRCDIKNGILFMTVHKPS